MSPWLIAALVGLLFAFLQYAGRDLRLGARHARRVSGRGVRDASCRAVAGRSRGTAQANGDVGRAGRVGQLAARE
jgi:hypothetical protein